MTSCSWGVGVAQIWLQKAPGMGLRGSTQGPAPKTTLSCGTWCPQGGWWGLRGWSPGQGAQLSLGLWELQDGSGGRVS